jgi:hypothetical protein
MDKIEKLIKGYLKTNLGLKNHKTSFCPEEKLLLDYLEQRLAVEECQIIESHIAGCGFCLSQLGLALKAQTLSEKGEFGQVVPELISKAKALLKSESDLGGMKISKPGRIKKNLFLIGAIVFFILSFLIPRYFLQFLVATLILGLRWAFESEGGRTLIMVLDSWRKHSHDEDEEISHRLKDRHNSFHK